MFLFAANERVESGRREEIDKGEEGREMGKEGEKQVDRVSPQRPPNLTLRSL